MKKNIIRLLLLFIVSQLTIFLLSFLIYREMSLLFYINVSFYIGALFIFSSLLFLTVKSGFFDGVTHSFRKIFVGKNVPKKEIEEMTLPSQMISFNIFVLLYNGVLITLIMLGALYLYFI